MLSSAEKQHKLSTGTIVIGDLPDYIQERALQNAPVHILGIGRWVLIGETWLFVKSICSDSDDEWAYIVVRPKTPFLDWILNPIAAIIGQSREVLNWFEIPGTKILLDFWYIGDGTGGTPLGIPSK